jgi:hypothetical protein
VNDGFWPGVIHLLPSLMSGLVQNVACEYAGCIICVIVATAIIAVVVITITKTRLVCFVFSIIYRVVLQYLSISILTLKNLQY